jgi:hypothetical protein
MSEATVKAVKMPPTLTALVRAARAGDLVAAQAAADWLEENGFGAVAEHVKEGLEWCLRSDRQDARWIAQVSRETADDIASHFLALALHEALAGVRLEDVPAQTGVESDRRLAVCVRDLFRTLGLRGIHVRRIFTTLGYLYDLTIGVPRRYEAGAKAANAAAVEKVSLILHQAFPDRRFGVNEKRK